MNPGTPIAWIDARHPNAKRKMWGLTLLERNIRELELQGIETIVLLTQSGEDPTNSFCHGISQTTRLRVEAADQSGPLPSLFSLIQSSQVPVIALEGHALNDRRLLKILVESANDLAILPEYGPAPAGLARLSRDTLEALEGVVAFSLTELLQTAVAENRLPCFDLSQFDTYMDNLRRRVPPYAIKVEDEATYRAAEKVLKRTVQKGVLEVVGKFIHPPLEFGAVRLIAESKITPNQITLVWVLLALSVIPLYLTGHLLLGTLFAALVGILDGVDGKLARLTLRFSEAGDKLDHISGTINDALWYMALGWYFSGGNLHSRPALFAALLLGSYLIHRIVPGLFRGFFAREIYDYQKIDEVARLIGARVNNNVWVFLIGLLLEKPLETFYLISVWMAITALWFIVRFFWVSYQQRGVEKQFELSRIR
ncbi:MAG: CDP-alcohol phosphatidyltransferase family protein [Calditrichaeota bacterium]|nr:MAG: CDP-alcohol phosphatidyltransferase family protein [Calditrichota bacterium]